MDFRKIIDEPVSFDTLEDAIEHLQMLHGIKKSDAMSAAAAAHPDLVEKYNSASGGLIKKAMEQMRYPTVDPAVREFNALVDEIRARDMCTGAAAMRQARAEDPKLFARYQAAGGLAPGY